MPNSSGRSTKPAAWERLARHPCIAIRRYYRMTTHRYPCMLLLSQPARVTGPRCQHIMRGGHQCWAWSVTTCDLCNRVVRPAACSRPVHGSLYAHHVCVCITRLCMCADVTPRTLIVQVCGKHGIFREYAYHFAEICDRCYDEACIPCMICQPSVYHSHIPNAIATHACGVVGYRTCVVGVDMGRWGE